MTCPRSGKFVPFLRQLVAVLAIWRQSVPYAKCTFCGRDIYLDGDRWQFYSHHEA